MRSRYSVPAPTSGHRVQGEWGLGRQGHHRGGTRLVEEAESHQLVSSNKTYPEDLWFVKHAQGLHSSCWVPLGLRSRFSVAPQPGTPALPWHQLKGLGAPADAAQGGWQGAPAPRVCSSNCIRAASFQGGLCFLTRLRPSRRVQPFPHHPSLGLYAGPSARRWGRPTRSAISHFPRLSSRH